MFIWLAAEAHELPLSTSLVSYAFLLLTLKLIFVYGQLVTSYQRPTTNPRRQYKGSTI